MTDRSSRSAALLLGAFVIVAASLPAAAYELEEVLREFDRVQNTIESLSAEFTETTRSALLKDEIVASGKVFLTKPSSVRWEYSSPETMRFVIADDRYTGYYPERKQAEQRDVRRWGEHLFRFLGIGQASGELAKFYNITLDDEASTTDEIVLILDPKKKRVRKRIESVRFWIDVSSYMPKRVRYSSSNGNVRLIEFRQMLVNPVIETSLYVVELPDDVEVSKGFSALSGLGKGASKN